MKFQIEAKSFKDALNRMVMVSEKRGTIPILQNVLIEVFSGSAYLTATDMDIQIRERVEVSSSADGAITVSSHMLRDLVAKLDDGPLVSVILDAGYLHLSSNQSKAKLHTLPEMDFPRLADSKFESSFSIATETLVSAFEKTIWAASMESTRYYLNGVAVQKSEDQMFFVATDGHRLSRYVAECASDFPDIIVPTKTVKQVVKSMTGDTVSVSISEAKVLFQSGNIEILSKTVDGTYPAWRNVIPLNYTDSVTGQSIELSNAIDRVATIATERTKAVKLGIADSVVTVTVVDPVYGTASDSVPVQQTGGNVEIGINSKYGLTALAQADKGDVTIQYNGSMGQIIVTYGKEPNLMCVVMPQRI